MRRQLQMLQLLTVAMLAFYVVAVVGCGSSNTPAAAQTNAVGQASLQIAENDSGFEPRSITVARGQVLNVTFTNRGQEMHNLRIAGGSQFMGPGDVTLGNPVVQSGQSATTAWTAPDSPGKRLFRCDVHPNHTGTIIIQ